MPLLFALIGLARGGWWVYDTFLRQDPPPVIPGPEAVGEDKVIDIWASAQVSRYLFNQNYRGKTFDAHATFVHADQDYRRYDFDVFVGGPYFADCRTADPDTIALLQKLPTNAPVRITGVIEDMNDRRLTLAGCALHRP
ncbi:MAG TPA: hypothetical protein VME45_04545 [Stellaceae bacterium]|nr:hypothetical protein [Stellaceae bacterium]